MPKEVAPLAVAIGVSAILGPEGMAFLPGWGAGIAGAVAGGLTASALYKGQTNDSMNAQSSSAQANVTGTTEQIPVIYGSRRVGGIRILCETSDSATKYGDYLNLVYAIAEGEASAINTVYLDDRDSTTLSGVTVEKYLGTDDQAASATLIAALPGKWTAAHRGRGIVYSYLQLTFNQSQFPNGLPLVGFDVDGKKVWDPRAQGSPSTLAFSDNPALCVLDYLMNERYGAGVPLSMIDEPTFVAASDYFDEMVTAYAAGSPSVMQKRYTCRGVLYPEAGYFANLNALLSSCRSMLVFSAGKWKLIPEKVETPTAFEFTEDNIVGAWTIKKAGRRERFNRVNARFFNPERQWTEDLAIYDNATHRAADADALFETEVSLPFTANVYTAMQLAQIEEKASRAGINCEFTATIEGMRCEVGDVVPITHSTTGWDAKSFRITRISLLNSDEVRVSAREYQASVYSLDDNAQVADAPATNLPNPFSNLTVTLGSPASGTEELTLAGDGTVYSRIRIPLTSIVNAFVDHYQVQFAQSGSPSEWQDSPDVLAPTSNVFVYPLSDGLTYDVRVRAVTSVGNAGDWAYIYGHTVIGKTAPPSDVAAFASSFDGFSTLFTWDHIADYDLAEYQVKRGSTWSGAVSVGQTLSNFLRIEVLGSVGTYLIKAIDTSGNESTNAASTVVTPVAPGTPAPSASFDGGDLKLVWASVAVTSYPLARYEVRYGATYGSSTLVGYVDVTAFRTLANWSGSRTWWVTAIDVAGTASIPASVEVVVTAPSAPSITPEVIDNNVLLRWTDATQTLPLKHYELRRGTAFAGATVIGTVQARFSVVFESSGATVTYWIVGVDSAGNYGVEKSVTVTVSQPPDFILYDQLTSDYSGTKTNCIINPDNGNLLVAMNTTETFEEHFQYANGGSPSWTTPQDQIDAGFPIYIEPSKTTGQYVEVIDYGTTIPSTSISVSLGSLDIAGSVTVTPTISVAPDGSPTEWTDYAGVWQTYATAFRYVKITLDFSSSGNDDLLEVTSLVTRLDVKIKRDSETVTLNAGDSGGTTINFNVSFIDIRSITLTAQGTTAIICVVDFTDAPNPTDFKGLAFDTLGIRATTVARWEASGV